MTQLEETLLSALERMDKMHELMMQKVNHGASFYDAETLHEMNSAPIQAAKAIQQARMVPNEPAKGRAFSASSD